MRPKHRPNGHGHVNILKGLVRFQAFDFSQTIFGFCGDDKVYGGLLYADDVFSKPIMNSSSEIEQRHFFKALAIVNFDGLCVIEEAAAENDIIYTIAVDIASGCYNGGAGV